MCREGELWSYTGDTAALKCDYSEHLCREFVSFDRSSPRSQEALKPSMYPFQVRTEHSVAFFHISCLQLKKESGTDTRDSARLPSSKHCNQCMLATCSIVTTQTQCPRQLLFARAVTTHFPVKRHMKSAQDTVLAATSIIA